MRVSTFWTARYCVDLVVVDQQRGPTMKCEWLEFGRLNFGDQGKFGLLVLRRPRIASELHLSAADITLA